MNSTTTIVKPDTRRFPRILCLHGGGVNAAIFKAQARCLIPHLQQSFRLVWADAPFICDPHADVITVYGTWGPFRRWIRSLPGHSSIDSEICIKKIGNVLRKAMEEDDEEGATGEWVGLMGFSQGAKISASLLLEQQAREEEARRGGQDMKPGLIGIPGLNWRFGILLAGSAPICNLNPTVIKSMALVDAGTVSQGFQFCEMDHGAILSMPTLHVHGLSDPGLHLHQKLFHGYCEKQSSRLVEWNGAHRIPFMPKDVMPIIRGIYDLAESTGVQIRRTV